MNYGLQMYSVRDAEQVNFAKAIEDVAKIGYKYVEFAGFFGYSAEDVKALLDNNGLICSGTHSPWTDLRPSVIMDTIKYHKAIGNPRFIIPGADLGSLEKIDTFCKVMNFAQPILAAEGIELGYHNHSHEFVVMPWGSTIHGELERRTNVNFEIDTFWAFNANLDPIATIERLKHRMSVIHLKDGFKANTPDFKGAKGMALGEGEAPVAAVRKKAIELGLTMVVESETCTPTGIEEVTRCFNYLQKLDAED